MKTDEFTKLINRLKSDKKTLLFLIIGFLGIFFVLISENGTESNADITVETNQQNILTENELAADVENLVEAIDGAGKAKVMITYESYEETVYAYDKNENTDAQGEREFRSEYIVLDSGDKEDGMKVKVLLPEVRGVAVVCQGGGNPIIKEQIITAISALFNISSNKISVAVMAK